MKSLFSIIAAVLLMGGAAFAADLPTTKGAPTYTSPSYDWTGVYVGGHVGGGWSGTTASDPSVASQLLNCCFLANQYSGPSAISNSHSNSFIGGAQIGAMYQIGKLVVGVDFDWSTASLKNSGASSVGQGVGPLAFGAGNSALLGYGVQTNWIQTDTVTFGYALDNILLYGKGGLALANNDYSVGMIGTSTNTGGTFNFSSAQSAIVPGYTIGAGAKYEFMHNWIVGIEYDYLNFGAQGTNIAGNVAYSTTATKVPVTFSPTFNQSISEVKAGLSYKFDWAAPSLFAKY